MIQFTKMNGAGNDFVLLDNRAGELQLTADDVVRICDRHRGVGADGILVLERAENGADFRMRYYNADGGEAEMCGNGARCFARFASRVAGPMQKLSFETPAGVIGAALEGELVSLQMSDPKDLRLALDLDLEGEQLRAAYINSGVPHVVVSVSDLRAVDVQKIGSLIRYHQSFAPKGANANFIEKRGARERFRFALMNAASKRKHLLAEPASLPVPWFFPRPKMWMARLRCKCAAAIN